MATIDLLHEIKGFPYLSVPPVASAFYSSGLGRMRYAPYGFMACSVRSPDSGLSIAASCLADHQPRMYNED